MTRKTAFFEEWFSFKFNNLRLALVENLKCCTSVAKWLKLKVRKCWGRIPTFEEVTEKKLVGGLFVFSPSWIGLMLILKALKQNIFHAQNIVLYTVLTCAIYRSEKNIWINEQELKFTFQIMRLLNNHQYQSCSKI